MNRELLAEAFDDRLVEGVVQALESIGATPHSVEPIRHGNRKRTAIVRGTDRGPVVVQVVPDPTWARTEGELLRAIANRTAVPVAQLLGATTHGQTSVLITEHVPGADLHEVFTTLEPAARARLARSFGTALAEIHEAFVFDSYGPIEVVDETLSAQRSTWQPWFEAYAARAIDRLPAAFDPLRADLKRVVTDSIPGCDPDGRLYAWDLRPGNALVADGRLTAILDWERPRSVPASLSVANAEYLVADWYVEEPEPLRDAFERGYTQVRPYPSIPVAYRVAAIADSAVDSTGAVTNPRYPPLDRGPSIAFHRQALESWI